MEVFVIVIAEAVRRTFPGATEAQIGAIISDHLKQAKGRLSKKKSKKVVTRK